jgi:nucleotide-binding universal stress UspA family protein
MKVNLLLLDSYRNMDSLIAYAFSFSHHVNRHLKIAYVYDVEWIRQYYTAGAATMVDVGLPDFQADVMKDFSEAEIRISAIISEHLKKQSFDVPFDIITTEISRIDLVKEEAAKKDSDLLLLIGNMEHYSQNLGGALAYPDLVSQVNCPVFIIPENKQYSVIKSIVYLTDFHPEDLDSIRHISDLFQNSALKIAILHNEKDFGFEEKLKWIGFVELAKQVTGINSIIPVIKKGKKVREALQEFIEINEVDLIGILKEKKGFIEELFKTSETKNVLKHFGLPLLVYHEN